jgi:hypothetical protein
MSDVAKGVRTVAPTGVRAAPEESDETLWREAAAVLDGNWTGTYTVPSRTLYPHQWSWDAGFISIGLAHVAPDRAWRDLRSLFEAQWPDGRVPHISFDPGVTERDYFPGPAFWRTGGGRESAADAARPPRPSSGIVQPPVHALAAWLCHQRNPDATAVAELRWLYPRLVAQQEYLATARDVGGAGLSALVHPWESGLDNSPAWDDALANVPVDLAALRRHSRHDTQVIASSHRPTDEDYARYLTIASAYRDEGYRDAGLADRHPFLVECPGFNALRAAAEQALARIAEVVGADPAPHRARAAAITTALLDRLFDPDTGMFHVRDLRTGRRSPARCVNGLLPLILPDLPAAQVESLVAAITSPRFGISERMPVPSYDRCAADFDPYRYWRGPVWFNINWLLWRGLLTHHREALAGRLRGALLDLVRRSGSYEYFHPETGAGIGSPSFSWTAALTLDLLAGADEAG